MSKVGGGCTIGLIFTGVALPSVGLLLASITGMAWLGGSIGEHSNLVTAYVVIGFIASYILPGLFTMGLLILGFSSIKNVGPALYGLVGVVVYLLVASCMFAIPSSFIAGSACHAGNQKSVWVMRVIPVFWGTETVLAPPGQKLACINGQLVNGG